MEFLLQDRGDGGEFSTAGDIKQDGTFYTAVYLSLFNGESFYNVYTENKTSSNFEKLLALPVTIPNLKQVEKEAQNALKWLIDGGIAQETSVFAYGTIDEKINVEITITQPSGDDCKFSITWNNEKIALREI